MLRKASGDAVEQCWSGPEDCLPVVLICSAHPQHNHPVAPHSTSIPERRLGSGPVDLRGLEHRDGSNRFERQPIHRNADSIEVHDRRAITPCAAYKNPVPSKAIMRGYAPRLRQQIRRDGARKFRNVGRCDESAKASLHPLQEPILHQFGLPAQGCAGLDRDPAELDRLWLDPELQRYGAALRQGEHAASDGRGVS